MSGGAGLGAVVAETRAVLADAGFADAAIETRILLAGLLMGAVPAWRAYRQSLADGLSIRS